MPGTLFVVATPIGNLEDITARALRVLREVTLIAAEDTRRTAHLLARYAITTRTTSLHEHNEASKSASLVERLQRGDDIALVSDAGTPTVSDPGARLIGAAIDSGARVEPIPGPNAALAALVASGLPSETYLFLGFPPIRSKDRKLWFDSLRTAGRTVVFFEAPHRIRQTLEELHEKVGDCRVAIGRELTKAHEEFVRGPISSVLVNLKTLKGEFTVVADIGHLTEIGVAEQADAVEDRVLMAELGHLMDSRALDRRAAMAVLTKRHNRTRNDIYEAIERAKKSGA